MKKIIVLPQLSTKIDGGTIVMLYPKVGERITTEQTLYDVESEKAVHEVTSPYTGIICRYMVDEGDYVSVGDPIAEIEVE